MAIDTQGRTGCLLAGFVLLACATAASAAPLMYEPFGYVGPSLDGQGAAELGLAGTWQTGVGLAADALNHVGDVGLSDDAASLEHPSLPASLGARVLDDGADAGTAKRSLDGFTLSWNTNDVWFISALIQGKGLIQFQSDAHSRISFGINDAGEFQVGFKATDQRQMSATYAGGAGSYDPDTTYLLVVQGAPSTTGGQDRIAMNVYDAAMAPPAAMASPAVEPGAWDLVAGPHNSGVVMNTISLAFYDAPGQIDEIRIGTEWADVVPEPASLLLFAAAGLGLLRRRAA